MTDIRFADTRPRSPRRVIAYGPGLRATYRNVNRDDAGRPEIVCDARDVTSIKLDFTDRMEPGELIVEATCTPCNVSASITYIGTIAILTVANPVDDGTVAVEIRTSMGEVFTERLCVRLPKRAGEDRRIGAAPFTRGVV